MTCTQAQKRWCKIYRIKNGDLVKVTRSFYTHESDTSASIDRLTLNFPINKIGTVHNDLSRSIGVSFLDEFRYFPFFVLKKVKQS